MQWMRYSHLVFIPDVMCLHCMQFMYINIFASVVVAVLDSLDCGCLQLHHNASHACNVMLFET